MPANFEFGSRKLPIASDDLIFFGLYGISSRVLLLGISCVCLGFFPNFGDQVSIGFLAGSIALSAIQSFLYFLLSRASLKGNILNWKLRDISCKRILRYLFFTYVIQAGIIGFGIYVCINLAIWNNLLAMSSLLLDLLFLLSFIHFFLSYLTPPKNNQGQTMKEEHYTRNLTVCGTIMKVLTCGVLSDLSTPEGHGEGAWVQISGVLYLFFHDMMRDTLVVTDMLCAMLLLRAEQKRRESEQINDLASSTSSPMSPGGLSTVSSKSNATQEFLWGKRTPQKVKLKLQTFGSSTPIFNQGSWTNTALASQGRVATPSARLDAIQALKEMDEYSPYMEAIYGWILILYKSPLSFIKNCFKWIYCCSRKKVKSSLVGRAFEHVVGEPIHFSFTANLAEKIPWAICLDHEKKAIIITLRGTFSFQDAGIDLMMIPQELNKVGEQWGFNGVGKFAHSGMLQIAEKIRYEIEKKQILTKIINSDDRCKEYRLMIVGHSMGAGVGVILALMLQNKFPNLRCLSYEPPGCIFDYETAEESKTWCNTVVCGVDCIPRANWQNLKRLRAQLLEVLRRSKTSKFTILSSLFRSIPAEDLMYDVDKVPNEPFRLELHRLIHRLSETTDTKLDQIPLCIPGKVLHLSKTETVHFGCFHKNRFYSPMWIENRQDFQEFKVSKYLLLNHFANYNSWLIKKTLKECLEMDEVRQSILSTGVLDSRILDSPNPQRQNDHV